METKWILVFHPSGGMNGSALMRAGMIATFESHKDATVARDLIATYCPNMHKALVEGAKLIVDMH